MISVIIPTYKSVDSFKLLLRSIVEGAYNLSSIQIIVVMDGHIQLYKDVLNEYSAHIDVLNMEQNVGLNRALNLAVSNAKYENILILNDDNVVSKHFDLRLQELELENKEVITPNQIEPFPSIFPQFIIKDLGRNPNTFDLEQFWEYSNSISHDEWDHTGSTFPIYMKKLDYLAVGGFDEHYPTNGILADWDFFLKCKLMKFDFIRTYMTHIYHFVSLSVNDNSPTLDRTLAEADAFTYANYKWGTNIKSDSTNNSKYL
jgi:glycosyltransferase involved in cell wall biosynthesis